MRRKDVTDQDIKEVRIALGWVFKKEIKRAKIAENTGRMIESEDEEQEAEM